MDILASGMDVFLSWLSWFGLLLMFFVGLGIVVFVHEFGHYFVAKMVGIRVERFALGFGPRLFGVVIGDTDYCIRAIPLGGYVKMLGQEDLAPVTDEVDPGAFNNKSVGARFAVISAGVIMNVIFAAIVFVILGMTGKDFPAPIVGETMPGFPAATATVVWEQPTEGQPAKTTGLLPGDNITQIDGDGMLLALLGSEVNRYAKLGVQATLSDPDDEYTLTIEREIDGKKQTGRAKLGLKRRPSTGTLAFGITPAATLKIAKVEESIYPKGVFEPDDVITAVNGQPVSYEWELSPIAKKLIAGSANVTVKRGGKDVSVKLTPQIHNANVVFLKNGNTLRGKIVAVNVKEKKKTITIRVADGMETTVNDEELAEAELLDVLGMIPRVIALTVTVGSPADKAGLQPGDVIASYGRHGAVTLKQLHDANKKSYANKELDIVLVRGDKRLEPAKITPVSRNGGVQIGILAGGDMTHLAIADVRENSPAAKAGIQADDVIQKINGKDVTTWADMINALKGLVGKKVTFDVKRGTASTQITIASLATTDFQATDFEASLLTGWPRGPMMSRTEPRGPIAALAWGAHETMFHLAVNYASIRSLISGDVSTKELRGPVGIGKLSMSAARKGFGDFMYFFAMISVGLAVVNFLPIPVVDGGHAVFLVYEKLRGKPPTPMAINILSWAGLALILGVFIWITLQDTLRIFSDMW